MISVPVNVAARGARDWPQALAFLATAVAALTVAFTDTAAGMVHTWWRSETFAHGVVIYPICLWLVWRDRSRLSGLTPAPSPLALLAFAAMLVSWWIGRLADAQVVQEGAFVSMVAVTLWAFLGNDFVRRFWFALVFSLFAVPFGEGLIPLLMEYTAAFTVGAVKSLGIPIYRDGMMFSLPSGDFQVAKACSGIRYLIASTALGSLYAYLTYTSPWRRVAFVAVAIVVPIVANGFRALGIVLIAHFTQMRYAVGLDHLLYGWIFFGVVVFLLFWVGSFWGDAEAAEEAGVGDKLPSISVDADRTYPLPKAFVVLGVGGLLVSLALAASSALSPPATGPIASPSLPAGASGWIGPLAPGARWSPVQPGADQLLRGAYRNEKDGTVLELAVAVFDPRGGAGDVSSAVNLVADRREWSSVTTIDRLEIPASVEGELTAVNRSILRGPIGEYAFLQWFAIGEEQTNSGTVAVLSQLHNSLRRRYPISANLVVAAQRDVPESTVTAFVATLGSRIARCATRSSDDVGDDECALPPR
ncbi:MAG: exosortase A [Pseudomonadota bacterium]